MATDRPEECTTGKATVRHLSLDLAPIEHPIITGRIGRTLCGRRAYDRLAASQNLGWRVRLADLKPCEHCERSAAKRVREATDGGE